MNKLQLLFLIFGLLSTSPIFSQIDEKKVYDINFSDFNLNKVTKEQPKETKLENKTLISPNLLNFKKSTASLTNINNAGFIINSNIDKDNFGVLKQRNIDTFGEKNDVANYKIKKLPNSVKNLEGGAKLVFTDQNLGEIITQSEYLDIYYRDHGQIDGDIIKLNVDEAPFVGKVVLGSSNKSVRLYLKEGFTKIDLYSIFDGRLYPNTVEWVIKDDQKRKVADNVLSVSRGFKGSIVVIKN